MFLFDIAPDPIGGSGGALGVFIVVAFFFVALASGIFAFLMLRKTIRIAIRMAIVGAVLLIAIFGSLALWLFLQPKSSRPVKNTPPSKSSRPLR